MKYLLGILLVISCVFLQVSNKKYQKLETIHNTYIDYYVYSQLILNEARHQNDDIILKHPYYPMYYTAWQRLIDCELGLSLKDKEKIKNLKTVKN